MFEYRVERCAGEWGVLLAYLVRCSAVTLSSLDLVGEVISLTDDESCETNGQWPDCRE